ncbi:hypothetical protein D3C80_797790 [compost metagenome]
MQTLKPCPFCGGNKLETYYCDIEGWIAHIKCLECDDMIGPMSDYKYETQEEAFEDAAVKWNTRPAAPVAGLELDKEATAENIARHISKSEKSGRLHEPTYNAAKAGALMALECSQAGAAIAAKDERLKEWQNKWAQTDILRLKAKAENAALAARVKELEERHESLLKDVVGDITTFRDTEPEEGETWESWYFAAFDLLIDRVRATFTDNSVEV